MLMHHTVVPAHGRRVLVVRRMEIGEDEKGKDQEEEHRTVLGHHMAAADVALAGEERRIVLVGHHTVLREHHMEAADIALAGEEHRIVLVEHQTVLGEHYIAVADIALAREARRRAVFEDRSYEKEYCMSVAEEVSLRYLIPKEREFRHSERLLVYCTTKTDCWTI